MKQLSTQPVGSLAQYTIHPLRLPARQIHNVRRVRNHLRDSRLRIVQQQLHPAQDRPDARLHIADQLIYFFRGALHFKKKRTQNNHLHH